MSFLLDTDTCSAFLKGNSLVWAKLQQHMGRHSISTITAGELYTWALRASAPAARLGALEDFIRGVQVLDITPAIAKRFGEVRASQLDAGQPTPDLDLLIGATALVHDLTLVTHNGDDYASIPGLRIEDWIVR